MYGISHSFVFIDRNKLGGAVTIMATLKKLTQHPTDVNSERTDNSYFSVFMTGSRDAGKLLAVAAGLKRSSLRRHLNQLPLM
jgi:hypothetical protein